MLGENSISSSRSSPSFEEQRQEDSNHQTSTIYSSARYAYIVSGGFLGQAYATVSGPACVANISQAISGSSLVAYAATGAATPYLAPVGFVAGMTVAYSSLNIPSILQPVARTTSHLSRRAFERLNNVNTNAQKEISLKIVEDFHSHYTLLNQREESLKKERKFWEDEDLYLSPKNQPLKKQAQEI